VTDSIRVRFNTRYFCNGLDCIRKMDSCQSLPFSRFYAYL